MKRELHNPSSMARFSALLILLGATACTSTPPQTQKQSDLNSSAYGKDGSITKNEMSQKERPALANSIEQELAIASRLLEMGDVTQAMERAHRLWIDLQARRTKPLDEELALEPQRRVALLYALAHENSDRSPSGLKLIEQIIASNPEWEPPYIALAAHYLRQNAYSLALRVTRTGLDRIQKPGATLFAQQTKALLAMNETKKAIDTLERALRFNPESPVLQEWQGHLAEQTGKSQEACHLFKLSYENERRRPTAAHNHALCLARAGDYDKAQDVLRLALAQNSRAAYLRLLTGHLLRKQGHVTEAREAWSDYLALAPADDPARKRLQIELETLGDGAGSDSEKVPLVTP